MPRPLFLPAASALAPALVVVLLLCAPALAQVPPVAKPVQPSFKALDQNRDGKVSLEEVLASATKKSAAVAPFRIQDVDLDGDGRLTPEELKKAGVTGLEHEGVINERELDFGGDGYVSREDLDEYFRRKHREAFAKADADKDGWLRQSEFALFRF